MGPPRTPRASARPRRRSARIAYVILEAWESAQALKAHIAAPHMAAYAEKTRHLIASRAIHILTPM